MLTTRVWEVMIPLDKYPRIPQSFTVLQTMETFQNAELEIEGKHSLPRVILVLDDTYGLVGMVRRRNILAKLEPRYLVEKSLRARKNLFSVKKDPQLREVHTKRIVRGIMENSEIPITEVMVPVFDTVDYEDHIFLAVYKMNEHDMSILPVMQDEKCVGVVRTVEIFNTIADGLLKGDYIW